MEILNDINNDIKFTVRSSPIPLGARMSYRIAQICLILNLCCSPRESCSMRKLQTISNALFQPHEFQKLIDYAKSSNYIFEFTPRIDPCVNTAIEFAIKYGLCKAVNNNRKCKLTSMGRNYVHSILKEDIMTKEKMLLRQLGANFSEEIIDHLMG